MRKAQLIFFAPILAICCCFKTAHTISPQKIFHFDQMVTDTGGHQHHVHGWLDVGGFPPKIQHWDVYYDSTHFQGRLASDDENPGVEDYEMESSTKSGDYRRGEEVDIDYQSTYDAMNDAVQAEE